MVIAILHKNKGLIGVVLFFSTILLLLLMEPKSPSQEFINGPIWNNINIVSNPLGVDDKKIEEWWQLRKSTNNLSKLGEILFLQKPEPKILGSDKRYQILVWKYGRSIENRHLKNFSGKRLDPFDHCPVNNCDITYIDTDLQTADIVIYHLHRIKGLQDIPKPNQRNPNQIWAFLTDESPYNTFLDHKNQMKDYNGIFNWSMSYRMDSDIPVPYGRTVLKTMSETTLQFNIVKRRDVLIAIMGSNCGGQNHRWKYVHELQKYIQVDVYGGCGDDFKKACPGHFGADCPLIDQYLFYLSFENSNCEEYVTEKLWWNAYHKNAIPIVMGSSRDSYKKLLPPDSYINIEEFASPRAMAEYILHLNKTEEYKIYYDWKRHFEVLNEHGYFGSKSYHYCRACQALNYNAKDSKVYSDLEKLWGARRDCHPAWDTWED